MSYKFKRYKIKWDLKKRKFKKIKKDRKRSREAYIRFRKNRAKMLAALRKNRKKIKRKAARNKNAGIQMKLKKARKKYKYLLQNSLEYNINNILFEAQEMEPEIEITEKDLDELDDILSSIKASMDFDTAEERKEFYQWISDSRTLVKDVLNHGNNPNTDENDKAISEILKFVDTYYKVSDEEGESNG